MLDSLVRVSGDSRTGQEFEKSMIMTVGIAVARVMHCFSSFRPQHPSMEAPPQPTKKRKVAGNAVMPKDKLLNALTPEQCSDVIRQEKKVISAHGNCWYSTRQVKTGGYPRVQLPQGLFNKIPEIKSMLGAKGEKRGLLKVALHQLAWRAAGNLVPDFTSGVDLSHTCKRGQALFAGGGQRKASDVERGCFNHEHLELVDHKINLDRGTCAPITECPYCRCLAFACAHMPRCGYANDALAARLDAQQVARVQVTFADGRQVSYDFPPVSPLL
jgi:hypothetical protein